MGEILGIGTTHFRRAREDLERFNPDLVMIFGDDQFENFKEDIIDYDRQGFPWAALSMQVNGYGNAVWRRRAAGQSSQGGRDGGMPPVQRPWPRDFPLRPQ